MIDHLRLCGKEIFRRFEFFVLFRLVDSLSDLHEKGSIITTVDLLHITKASGRGSPKHKRTSEIVDSIKEKTSSTVVLEDVVDGCGTNGVSER